MNDTNTTPSRGGGGGAGGGTQRSPQTFNQTNSQTDNQSISGNTANRSNRSPLPNKDNRGDNRGNTPSKKQGVKLLHTHTHQVNEGKYTGYRYILSSDLPIEMFLTLSLHVTNSSSTNTSTNTSSSSSIFSNPTFSNPSSPNFNGWDITLITHYCELSPCYRKTLDMTDMEVEDDLVYNRDEGVIVPSSDEERGGGRR